MIRIVRLEDPTILLLTASSSRLTVNPSASVTGQQTNGHQLLVSMIFPCHPTALKRSFAPTHARSPSKHVLRRRHHGVVKTCSATAGQPYWAGPGAISALHRTLHRTLHRQLIHISALPEGYCPSQRAARRETLQLADQIGILN